VAHSERYPFAPVKDYAADAKVNQQSRRTKMTQAIEWVAYQGRLLYDPDGNAIGTIEEFYIDSDDGEPMWALVYIEPTGMDLSFVPLREPRIHGNGEDLQVSVSGDEVRDAPSIEAGGELSHDDERRLYQHYDMPYPEGETRADDASRSDDQSKSDDDQRSRKRVPRLLRRLLHRDRDT
jgi:hypothetical protein